MHEFRVTGRRNWTLPEVQPFIHKVAMFPYSCLRDLTFEQYSKSSSKHSVCVFLPFLPEGFNSIIKGRHLI